MENLICIAGLRGAGKETLVQAVLSWPEVSFTRVVPFTTRLKRANETHGKEYLFVEKEKFFQIKESRNILYKTQIGASDTDHYFSGTLKDEFDRHNNGIIDITAEGARLLSHSAQRSLLFFVYADPEERCRRIMQRQNIGMEDALILMGNEPSPATLHTVDKLYPEFTIVYNHDNKQEEAHNFAKRVIQESFNRSRILVK
jgi:guanylate kinase